MTEILLVLFGMTLGAIGLFALRFAFKRRRVRAPQTTRIETVFERVASAGRLVGLEVYAREIATTTRGLAWLPPIILSKARLAMIFHFEKQYSVDLSTITTRDVTVTAPGRYRVALPPVAGQLRLIDVTPYDIAAGRVLGLFDVIPMDADTQKKLMEDAQEQAASLYERHAQRYETQARKCVEQQLRALLAAFNVHVEIVWREGDGTSPAPAGIRSHVTVETQAPLSLPAVA